MTRFVYSSVLLLLLSTLSYASASNSKPSHEIGSQAFDSSTHVVGVARREIACTPGTRGATGTEYFCQSRGYTQVPNTEWIPTTTLIYLQNNFIRFIPVNAFNGLTLMTYLNLYNNAITSIPVRLLDNNPALEYLSLAGNPLVCPDTRGWNVYNYAISTMCTSCNEGTPETITVNNVDFWQCFIPIPVTESPTLSPPTYTTKGSTRFSNDYDDDDGSSYSTSFSPFVIVGPIIGICIVICCCIACCVFSARSNGSAGTAHNAAGLPPPVLNSGYSSPPQGGGIVSNPLMIGTAVVGSAAATGILAHQMSNNSNNAHDGGGFTTNDLPPTYDDMHSNAAWGLDP